ncbi:Cuticle protein CP14.6 [Amphibalanus amphitrite]|uniref:Cuticle protein CP14.6 n=1 Tax=Amphibalanus amphitrite TaxID=1232801 RepID=A0A6A4X0I8_AMPAM|nr:Cuticle protein CP14.6 [Amphibalanus amphitrite]
MPGMFPKTKKSKLDICTETAKFSAKLKHADVTHKTSVLKDSFGVRRICLTSNRNRKTGEEMEIFPDMYSEAAVWTDLGMIMGLEEDVKEHVLAPAQNQTYREEVCPDDDKRGAGRQRRFKTGNEINREEEGALKDVVVKNDNGQEEVKRVNVVRGVIRYPKDDGTFYELSYIADELGFRPVSSDIPSAPLP